ncbi:MAG: DUF885 domain-containing protein [Planctomycetes bacterium]|nr:DUF885 domain-containing protein [Planctomycetota bacterium]
MSIRSTGVRWILCALASAGCSATGVEMGAPKVGAMDDRFEALGVRYLDEFPALSPVGATWLGDHRFDGKLDDVSAEGRARALAFYRRIERELEAIPAAALSRANQVDRALLAHRAKEAIWEIEELREWAWNPVSYTQLTGSAVYSLMAREFAPLTERLGHVADRLAEFPRLFRQIRKNLDPPRVPAVHAETAVKQNRGVLSTIDAMVVPHMDALSPADRDRLAAAIATARQAVEEHQVWLEKELLPAAKGDFRIGARLYDRKLAFALMTPLARAQVRERAEAELRRARDEMYDVAKEVYRKEYPYTELPEDPTPPFKQAIIRAALEIAYRQRPARDGVMDLAKSALAQATAFVREKGLVTIPPDPIEIIEMPEFQRGVSLAYCDSPGPLDVGQKTFYAISPIPDEWTEEQVRSFLREYNIFSTHNLTIHEAMPGHYLQLAHANRYPGKLRAVLSSGTFIEGWAIYGERTMCDAGYMDGDPLFRLIVLKWYIRAVSNAILDQEIHAGDMTREEAMRLMVEETFQEEREAAAKWVRAQLTSAQLSTYFVGVQEMFDVRREVEEAQGEAFTLKGYHDKVLSFGSPPPRFARALLLDLPIPETCGEGG